MEQSRAQKILGILGNIDLILAVVEIIFGILLILGLNLASSDQVVSQEVNNLGGELYFMFGKMLVGAILLILEWRALRNLSQDATKYQPAWILTLLLLAFELFNFITNLGKGATRNLVSVSLSVVVGLIALYLINGIRIHSKKNQQGA
ncbi:MAG: hypothetical protein J6D29_05640 [Solobacterium sp.]|nr:hypothetical protein [Solobacterium sp.]